MLPKSGGILAAVRYFVVIIALLCMSQNAFATGTVGGEIYYTYSGGTTYRVFFSYYVDCNGVPPANPPIYVKDGTKTNTYSTKLCCISYYDADIPSGQCTRCSNMSCTLGYGVQFRLCYADVDVSVFNNCSLGIYCTVCCSNNAITTCTAGTNMYIETKLNRCNGDHNSPQFQESPPILASYGMATDIFQTVTPANRTDSIVYKLIPAYTGLNTTVAYNTGYNYDHPLVYFGTAATDGKPEGFHYGSSSGELFFIPEKTDVSLISMEADEYAKDKSGAWYLAGSTIRLNQIASQSFSAANNNPQINSNYTNDTIYTCAGVPVTLKIKTGDKDTKDSVILSSINETNGTISYKAALNASATYTWTPGNQDVSPVPYHIIFTAKDNVRPVCGMVQQRFYIFVTDSMPNVSISHQDFGCGKYSYSANANPSTGLGYQWTIDGNPVSKSSTAQYVFPSNGTHIIDLQITNKEGCVKHFYDTTKINLLPNVNVSGGKKICPGDNAQLSATGGLTYQWTPSFGLSANTGASITASPKTTTLYYVWASDNLGCKAIDSVKVTVDSFHVKIQTDTAFCLGTYGYVRAQAPLARSFRWVNKSGKLLSDSAGIFFKIMSDTNYVLTVSDSFGCIQTFAGIVRAHVPIAHAGPDLSMCLGDSVQLHASGGVSYKWNPGNGLMKGSTLQNPYVSPARTQNFVVSVSDSFGCIARDTAKVSVSTIYPIILKPSPICPGDSVQLAAFGGTNYSWRPTVGLSDSNSRTPYARPTKTTTYYVTICDSSCSCKRLDSVTLVVGEFKKLNLGANKNICNGISATIGDTARPGYSYYWTSSANGFSSQAAQLVVFPTSSATYYVREENKANGCFYSDSVAIHVVSTRASGILGKDSVCSKDIEGYKVSGFDSVLSYSWNITGGHFLSKTNNQAFVTWDSAGSDMIQLNVSYKGQCQDSTNFQVLVEKHPKSKILAPGIVCTGEKLTIADSNVQATSYKWNFGNGDGSISPASAYSYAQAGKYKILLVMADGVCATIDSALINVDTVPVRKPTISYLGNKQYAFENLDSAGLLCSWDLGDGKLIKSSTVHHTYKDAGTYKVVFQDAYPWGCPQEFDTTIQVSDTIKLPQSDSVFISPNPFTDQLIVHIVVSAPLAFQVSMIDALGRLVLYQKPQDLLPGTYDIPISAHTPLLRSGMYLLKYTTGDKVKIFRVVKI